MTENVKLLEDGRDWRDEGPGVLVRLPGKVRRGGWAVVNPDLVNPDPALLQLIPEHLMQRYKSIPLAENGNWLMLGMVDPANTIAIDDIRLITGYDIMPVQLASFGGDVPTWDEVRPGGQTAADETPVDNVFPLQRLAVRARVTGPIAMVEVEQTFHNPFDEALEALYIFPLSPRAAVSDFRMRIGNREIVGQIQEKRQARKTYEKGKLEGRRSALLEQERPDVFSVRVANLMPGENVTIRLEYAERLEMDAAETLFRLPLVVAPRYIPGEALDSNQGAGYARDTDRVPDASRISPPVLPPELRTGAALSVEVELETGGLALRTLACSQHATSLELRDGLVQVRLASDKEPLDRDFVLRFGLQQKSAEGILMVSGDHFLLSIQPPEHVEKRSAARDVLFLIDRSGSMGGEKMKSARRALLRFLESLEEDDRFAICAFDEQLELFAGGDPQPLSRLNEARAWVEAHCRERGGTEIREGIEWMLTHKPQSERILCGVLLTDGQVGNESEIYRLMQSRGGALRLFTLGVDSAVNESFLREMALLGRGTCELVAPGERLEAALDRLQRELGVPVVTDLRLEDRGFHLEKESLYPSPIPDLFAGRPVVVCGKRRGEGELIVHGRSGKAPWSKTLSPETSNNPAVGLLWAKERLRSLQDKLALAGAGQRSALETQARELALSYGLLSPYTSFVLVDREVAVNPGGANVQQVQPVELPAGWTDQGCSIDHGAEAAVSAMLGSSSLAEVDCTVKDLSACDFGPLDFDEPAEEAISLDKLKELVDEAPIVRVVNLILNQAIADRASHVHIEAQAQNVRVRYRVDGMLHDVMNPPKHIQASIAARLKLMGGLDIARWDTIQFGEFELVHDQRAYKVEVSTLPTVHGETLILSIHAVRDPIPAPGLDPGLLGRVGELLSRGRGLLLVCGPRRSGRTSLMSALLATRAQEHSVAACGKFRPVLPGVTQIPGLQLGWVASALQGRDVDFLGATHVWARDDWNALLQLANEETTVLVRTPDVHAVGGEELALRNALLGAVVLRKLPVLCECRKVERDPKALSELGIAGPVYRRHGCDRCKRSGYRGTVGVAELHEAVDGELVRSKSFPSLWEQARDLAAEGRIEAALSVRLKGELAAREA